MDTYYDTDSQWKMDKFVSSEGTDRSKMLKTAIYSSIKKTNDHDDGLGPAWPKKGEMHTENG